MQLIRELYAPDIAVLPIDTFPILIVTPAQLKDELRKLGLENVEVIEMTPGQTIK